MLFDYLTLFFEDGGTPAEAGTANGQENTEPTKETETSAEKDSKNEKKYSDADVDRIIEKKLAKWQKQKDAAVDEATRLANMSAQERAEHERDKLQKELDELKAANTRAEMEKTARGILQSDNVNVPDNLVATLVATDADQTSENVKAFVKAFKDAVQDEVKRQLTQKTPKTGDGHKTLTQADILKEKDPRKRTQLIRENINLFKK